MIIVYLFLSLFSNYINIKIKEYYIINTMVKPNIGKKGNSPKEANTEKERSFKKLFSFYRYILKTKDIPISDLQKAYSNIQEKLSNKKRENNKRKTELYKQFQNIAYFGEWKTKREKTEQQRYYEIRRKAKKKGFSAGEIESFILFWQMNNLRSKNNNIKKYMELWHKSKDNNNKLKKVFFPFCRGELHNPQVAEEENISGWKYQRKPKTENIFGEIYF